jgi:nicotinamidase-related amidase
VRIRQTAPPENPQPPSAAVTIIIGLALWRCFMNQTLLLIDIQNDYFPGGAMELAGSPGAGLQAGKPLFAFRQRSLPVIHIQHIATRPGGHLLTARDEGRSNP